MAHRERDPAVTSRMMATVKNKNSRAELLVRRRLHAMGLRYRLHYTSVHGRPDLVFPRQKVAVFIDGDFWHGNAWRLRGLTCLADMFPNRTEWWVEKITRTMRRDAEVTELLIAEDWRVLRFWESDVLANPDQVVLRIHDAVVVGIPGSVQDHLSSKHRTDSREGEAALDSTAD